MLLVKADNTQRTVISITYCNNLAAGVSPELSEGPLLVLAPLEVGPRLAPRVLVDVAAVGAHQRVARLLAPRLDPVLADAALPPLRVVVPQNGSLSSKSLKTFYF